MPIDIGTPITEILDGKRYTHFIVIQDLDTNVGEEFSVPIPRFCTLTLLQQQLLGAGTAIDTLPVVGDKPLFVVDGDGHVVKALARAATQRIGEDKRIVGVNEGAEDFGRVYIRSGLLADLEAGQTVTTRITLVWGHR